MSNKIVKISNHIPTGLSRLLQQYKGKPNLENLLRICLGRFQDIEDALTNFSDRLDIANQTGEQLDGIGEIIGQPRHGYSDDYYRVMLLARIATNVSRGTIEDVISVFRIISTSNLVKLTELYPAGYEISTSYIIGDEKLQGYLMEMLNAAKPAGVSYQYVSYYDEINGFTFGKSDESTTKGLGFSSLANPNVGGIFGRLYK